MLGRAERKGLPPDSPFRAELTEVRQITQETLEKMRGLSQMLHPAVLDDYGLVKGLDWYTQLFEKQTGIATTLDVKGEVQRITGQAAIHCFRIVQEALNNAAKHAQRKSPKWNSTSCRINSPCDSRFWNWYRSRQEEQSQGSVWSR